MGTFEAPSPSRPGAPRVWMRFNLRFRGRVDDGAAFWRGLAGKIVLTPAIVSGGRPGGIVEHERAGMDRLQIGEVAIVRGPPSAGLPE